MHAAARILIGYRDDLDLSTRWWHRLLVVLGVLGLLVFGGVTGLLFSSDRYEPQVSDVRIIDNLRAFTKRAKRDVPNTIPDFLALPGELGGIKDGRKVVFVSGYSLEKSVCSADLSANAVKVTELINSHSGKSTKVSELTDFLAKEEEQRKPTDEKRYCILNGDIGMMSDEIIKYELTTLAEFKGWTRVVLLTTATVLSLIFVTTNVYYRGLVYVICGPRTRRETEARSNSPTA